MRFFTLLAALSLLASCTNPNISLSGRMSSASSMNAGIVNGQTATEADVSAQAFAEPVVAIVTNTGLCSGSLISPEIVLTAGHCFEGVKDASEVIVVLHALSLPLNGSAKPQPATVLGFKAAAYTINPNFDKGTNPSSLDDLALIRLSHAVPVGTKFASLPPAAFDYSKIAEAMALGYGVADDRHSATLEQSGAGTLRYLTFAASNMELLPFDKTIPDSVKGMLVAGSDQSGVCSGDSGGPLMASAAGVSTNMVIAVNDAVIAHYSGQQQTDYDEAAKTGDLAGFYKKYPDAHDCIGGLNLFVPVTQRLPWITSTMAALMKSPAIARFTFK